MNDNSSLTIKRVINAKPKAIFEALTNKKILEKWFYADPEGVGATVRTNAHEGGTFKIDMHGQKETFTHTGEYKEVVPNKKLVFTWNSHVVENTLVTITLNETGEGTEVTLVHEFMPNEKMREGHTKGWNVIFDHLDELVSKEELSVK